MKFWDSLAEKGKYATIIGFVIAVITIGIFVYFIVRDEAFEYLPIVLGWGFSVGFFILPSSFKAKLKEFEIEIKD